MKSFRLKGPLRFIIPSFIALILLALSYFRIFDTYELETLDFRFLLRSKIPTTDKVVLIEIGDDSIKNLGKWPLDRSYHAFLVKALSEAGAKAVIFDIFFSEQREHDDEFEHAMAAAKNVYLPFVFDIDTEKHPPIISASGYTARNLEYLSAVAKGEGHINIIPDIDGKFRRVPLFISYKNKLYPYTSLLAGCDYLKIPMRDVTLIPAKYIQCAPDIRIPIDDSSSMIINFSGRWDEAYKHYSYVDILQSYMASVVGQKPILDLSIFKGKVCIVGLTAAGTVDLHPNPFEPLFPGFGIHAEVFNSIINKKFIMRSSRECNAVLLAILSLLIAFLTLKMRPIRGLMVLIISISLFITAGILLFNIFGIWIDLFYPAAVFVLLYFSCTLYKYVAEWKRRIVLENELEIAKKIQESFLPKLLPTVEGIEIAAVMFTARQVGGDLYDFLQFSDDRLGVMIGDVSGKGVPASLFMAMATSEFKFFATPEARPNDVLRDLNARIVKESSSNLFVTMFYCIFDMKARSVIFSNGGHLPLLHTHSGKDIEFLDTEEGTPLGLMESDYVSRSVSFEKGDIFVFYTDGITEAMNAKSELYEKERLAAVVGSKQDPTAKALLHAIERDVRKFEPKESQHDDMTVIVIKIV